MSIMEDSVGLDYERFKLPLLWLLEGSKWIVGEGAIYKFDLPDLPWLCRVNGRLVLF